MTFDKRVLSIGEGIKMYKVLKCRYTTLRIMRECMRWLGGSLCTHSCDLPPSFWRCSLMETSSAIALIPYKGGVLKTLSITNKILTGCDT